MSYFLAISCVVTGWVMLRLLGAERTDMVRQMESQLRQAAQEQPLPLLTAPPAKATDAPAPKQAALTGAPPAIKTKH